MSIKGQWKRKTTVSEEQAKLSDELWRSTTSAERKQEILIRLEEIKNESNSIQTRR